MAGCPPARVRKCEGAGTVAAIIPAGGERQPARSGRRARRRLPRRCACWPAAACCSAASTSSAPYVDEIVVAAPADVADSIRFHVPGVRVVVVPGGQTRQESVRNALDALSDSVAWVLVHDAARPLVPADVVRRVLDALRDGAPMRRTGHRAARLPAVGGGRRGQRGRWTGRRRGWCRPRRGSPSRRCCVGTGRR